MDTKELIKSGNKALFSKGNLDIIVQLFDKDYVVHSGGKDYKGHEFIKRWVRQLRSAISDIQIEKVEFLVQSDNTIVWQRTLSGTHKTEFMGIKPTNKKIVWRDMAVSRFNDEKITEEWVVSELLGEVISKSPSK